MHISNRLIDTQIVSCVEISVKKTRGFGNFLSVLLLFAEEWKGFLYKFTERKNEERDFDKENS